MKLVIKSNTSIKNYLIVAIILIFIFQIPLQNVFPIFKYYDEIIVILVSFLSLCGLLSNKTKVTVSELIFVSLIAIIILIGLISNYTSKLNISLSTIVMDIGNNYKSFLVFACGIYLHKGIKNKEDIINKLAISVRFIVLIAFILLIANSIFNIGLYDGYRYGIKTYYFVYNHSGLFNVACYYYIVILTADLSINTCSRKKKYLYIALSIILWLSTLRTRAFIYILLYIVVLPFILRNQSFKIKNKTKVGMIILMVISIWIAYPQIEKYFINEASPRSVLLRYGIKNMITYFPFGSGFGSYGSFAASLYYSPLYFIYGFTSVYGLNYIDRQFLTDNYWPSIMGQLGVFGTILTALLLFYMVKIILEYTKKDKYIRFSCVFLYMMILYASLVTSSFANFTAVGLFYLITIYAEKERKK